jgi:hypothetical protein
VRIALKKTFSDGTFAVDLEVKVLSVRPPPPPVPKPAEVELRAGMHTPAVCRAPIDQDVDVLRRARPRVEADRVCADDQVPNAMGVE